MFYFGEGQFIRGRVNDEVDSLIAYLHLGAQTSAMHEHLQHRWSLYFKTERMLPTKVLALKHAHFTKVYIDIFLIENINKPLFERDTLNHLKDGIVP